ncbi:hypothetical protein OEZ85_008252 [Tetradesmus obliquus]|uniref:FH2 domain-containing protein n=1 Tax=Tetradesmus obliquus TaxID=3088 RepID=A0ABY8TIB0_TETOB|nr:hypothetical protein OEZ85_008252 [Tetradesmus obliquus]
MPVRRVPSSYALDLTRGNVLMLEQLLGPESAMSVARLKRRVGLLPPIRPPRPHVCSRPAGSDAYAAEEEEEEEEEAVAGMAAGTAAAGAHSGMKVPGRARSVSVGGGRPAGVARLEQQSTRVRAAFKLDKIGHKLPAGSFWRVADPVGKEFKDSMEYLLRAMFSDVPRRHHQHQHHRSSPRNTAAAAGGAAGAAEGAGPEGAAAAPAAAEVVTCVPEKRALHVEVALKRLRMPPAALAAAINLLNTEQLKPDDMATIRSILPKPEELQAVRDAKQEAEQKFAAAVGNSPRTPAAAAAGAAAAAVLVTPSTLSPRLGIVEAAFHALGGVELLQAKMRAMEFRYDVDAVASMVSDYTADIGRSLDALRLSGSLQYLLAFVRDVANTMNRAGPKGPLEGFKLESLARLQSTKMSGSTDLNLLHYIVAHMSAVLPGVLALDGEREAFRAACRRGTFDAVSVRIRTLLDTQKKLNKDLAQAKELQQRNSQQQQPAAAAAAADSPQAAAGGASSTGNRSEAPRTPAVGVASSSDGAGGSSSSSSNSSIASHNTYVARLSELLESSAPKVDRLQRQLEDVITKFRWIAEYYSEDVKGQAWKQQPVSFLTHFLELLDAIASTMKDSGRLARVTAMLADYVETQKSWHQQQAEQQAQAQLQELAAAEARAVQQAAEDEEERSRQALLQQQQLLREHAAKPLALSRGSAAHIGAIHHKFLTSEAAQKVAESNQEVAAKLKALKEKRGGQTTLTATAFPVKVYPKYSAADIEEHNEAIAIFLYGCNQPLSLVEHPDFQQMVFTLAPHMKGKLIARKALATTMLDKVYGKTQSKVEGFLQEQYVATSTDAWSSSHNAGAHVLNYFNRKALIRDGAVRDAEDFAAYVKWLDSLNDEEEQEKQQQQQQEQQ